MRPGSRISSCREVGCTESTDSERSPPATNERVSRRFRARRKSHVRTGRVSLSRAYALDALANPSSIPIAFVSLIRMAARGAWALPILLVLLCGHQAKVAVDLTSTRTNGTAATAEVLDVHLERRVDVTYDYISLRVPLPDGGSLTKEKLALPHSLVPALQDKETLNVRVQPGAARDVVVTEAIGSTTVVDTQRRIAMMNTAISFAAALLFAVGIFYWNRTLTTTGDPSQRGVTEPDPDHPARKVMR